MTTYIPSAAAPGYKWRRQASPSPPVVRLRVDLNRFYETNPFSSAGLPALPSRHKLPERNKPILGHDLPSRSPITKQTHFGTQSSRHKPPLRNKPIFVTAKTATLPRRRNALHRRRRRWLLGAGGSLDAYPHRHMMCNEAGRETLYWLRWSPRNAARLSRLSRC